MLRRAENVGLDHQPGLFTGRGWVVLRVGRSRHRVAKVHRTVFAASTDHQRRYPAPVLKLGERRYWQFQDRFYWDNDDLTAQQVCALLVTRQQREAQRIDRAEQILAVVGHPGPGPRRGAIADDVKQLVWVRDHGQCRHCGSQSELQFDHIIAVARGGSSDADNLQILCGPCNRRKGAGLTLR